MFQRLILAGEQSSLLTRIAATISGSCRQLAKRRKQRLPRRIYETTKTLAAQFAPQGNQAERSESEQGKCRACIGNARWGHADVVEQ